MRNARQFAIRSRSGFPPGRCHARATAPGRTVVGPGWPAPVHGYFEATGRDADGHLLLSVVPVPQADVHRH